MAKSNKQTDKQREIIKKAFELGMELEKSEAHVKTQMISAGESYGSINSRYKELLIECGYAIAPDERKRILNGILEGKELLEKESFEYFVNKVMEVLSCDWKSGSATVRQWAKFAKVPYYITPKAEVKPPIAQSVYDWIEENFEKSEDALIEYIKEVGTKNTHSQRSHYIYILNMAKNVAKSVEADHA